MEEQNDWTNEADEEELSKGFPQMEEGGARFELKRIDVKPHIKHNNLRCIAVAEECILMATRGNQVVRKKLNPEGDYELLTVPCRSDAEIMKLFVDVHGYHCLIALSKGETYYLSLNSGTVVPLNSLKGLTLTAVAYGLATTLQATGDVLLGTSEGAIYMHSLDINPKLGLVENAPKKVFQLPQCSNSAIYGMVYDTYNFQDKNMQGKLVETTLVLLATNEVCYQFVGALPFPRLFEKYGSPAELNKHKKVVPRGNMEESELKVYHTCTGKGQYELHSFAWKTGVGIVHGKFRDRSDVKSRVTIKDMPLDPYKRKGVLSESDSASTSGSASSPVPEAICVTEHSIYLLYPDSLSVMSKITHDLVHSESFRLGETMKQMTYEASTKSVWIHSSKSLNRLLVSNDNKDLWRQHVESGNYKEALQHCRQFGKENYPHVAGICANSMFKSGMYSEAAVLYAESDRSFEDVVLRFLRAGVTNELERNIRFSVARSVPDSEIGEHKTRAREEDAESAAVHLAGGAVAGQAE